ncbi:MAG TPA: hypothetical protein VMY88_01725 [Acidimicrobiales bacterium]|nr:hypothetical protein [Acidimicrobiales bacterium]
MPRVHGFAQSGELAMVLAADRTDDHFACVDPDTATGAAGTALRLFGPIGASTTAGGRGHSRWAFGRLGA